MILQAFSESSWIWLTSGLLLLLAEEVLQSCCHCLSLLPLNCRYTPWLGYHHAPRSLQADQLTFLEAYTWTLLVLCLSQKAFVCISIIHTGSKMLFSCCFLHPGQSGESCLLCQVWRIPWLFLVWDGAPPLWESGIWGVSRLSSSL